MLPWLCPGYNNCLAPPLVTRRTRLKLGERHFPVAAPRIWNQQLPIDIKAATDTEAVKQKLKTH